MSSMRDAMRRLQIVYENCSPEAAERKEMEAKLDQFTRYRKQLHGEVKLARQAIKERDALIGRGGTTSESAEASYQLRIKIKSIKETLTRMQEIHDKEVRKAKGNLTEDMLQHKEVMDLVKLHVEELEKLERKKGMDGYDSDRNILLHANAAGDIDVTQDNVATDESALPDIYVEEDLKRIAAKNKEIDDDLDVIGEGVTKLKEIALDINQELDKQDETLQKIDKKADIALDHVDNINVSMKKALDGFMPADNFMVNCVLICIILAFVGYISSMF